jgi:two-component system sensor histidine kinase CiaH
MIFISAIIIIGFFTAYTFTRQSIEQQSDIIMHGFAQNEEKIHETKKRLHHENSTDKILDKIFIVTVSTNGKIIDSMNTEYLRQEKLIDLSDIVIKKTQLKGYIKHEYDTFKYIKVIKEYGFFLVFLDTGIENAIFSKLFLTIIVIAVISLILVLLISIYLSGKAIKPVKESWERQTSFVSDASHELRTPLAAIKTNLEIVMDNTEESVDNQNKWLGNIDKEIIRMTKMVTELLMLARYDMKNEIMVSDRFNISNAVKHMMEVFTPLLNKKSIQLISKVEPDIIIIGNEGRINQLFTILLDNAMNYTSTKGLIEICLKRTGKHCDLTVKDTGEGIPEEETYKVFERFYRVDKSRSRNTGGSGLGLSLAKLIVKEHKGNITVKSKLGEGTEFCVHIPIFIEIS